MNIHNLSKESVLRHLVTSDKGLSDEEASKRLNEYGLNEIKEIRGKPLYRKFISQFTHFLAVLLWIAVALCFLSEYLHPGEGLLHLGMAILGVIFVNALFTFIQEYRAERAIKALKRLLPFKMKVLRSGKVNDIPSEKVVPGDIMLLNEGDRVPADARLIESNSLMVNNAPLTGESDARPRSSAAFEGDYLESPNIVFAGTLVISGYGRAVAFATGMATEFGKIAHLTGGVQGRLSPLQREIARVTKIVAVIAMFTGIFFFVLGFVIGRSFWHNFLFAVGIIIANVPEGLLPTVTLSLAMGSQRMAKKKALIKALTSVETLGSVNIICTDKTGTLTQNRMEVQRVWTLERRESGQKDPIPGVRGQGSQLAFEKGGEGGNFRKDRAHAMLMTIASLCNNAVFDEGKYRGDPTEVAILKAARDVSGYITAGRIHEIPFDSGRKRMTTVNTIDGRSCVCTKGALETVLPLCGKILAGNKEEEIGGDIKETLMRACHSMMDEGLRVIAFAYKEMSSESGVQSPDLREGALNSELQALTFGLNLESNLIFAGLMGIEDPPRREVPEAIKKCKEAGIKVIMITGDASRTAVSIARQIGLVKNAPVVVEGHEMHVMQDSVLKDKLSAEEIIFSRMAPAHKMRIVSILEDEGERVAVTGDGVNDAPALKKANIGIAMGVTGTDVAREAADMVLLDDNFASIVNAIEEGRAIFENIRKFISYIFASNIPEIIPYIAYVIFRIPLPLTIMQILAVDLGTDIFPAVALGAEKPSREVMRRPPRDPEEKLLNLRILRRAYFFLGPIEAFAGLFGFFYVLNLGGWQWGTETVSGTSLYMRATTACLAGIVITQIANVFACRSFRESVISIGFFSNRLIITGIIIEAVLSSFIVYHPLGNKIFGTAPLEIKVWLLLVPFGIALLFAEEVRKFYARRSNKCDS